MSGFSRGIEIRANGAFVGVTLIVAAVAGLITADVPVTVGHGRLIILAVAEFASLIGRFPSTFFAVTKPVDRNTRDGVWGTFLVSIQ